MLPDTGGGGSTTAAGKAFQLLDALAAADEPLSLAELAVVLGLERGESEALLDELWAHATRPEHCYAHRWRVGDLLLWDNFRYSNSRVLIEPIGIKK